MTAMTLRLPEDIYERLRKEAFDRRTSITALIVEALTIPDPPVRNGCDVCGKPTVHITTPGGIRFCETHALPRLKTLAARAAALDMKETK